MSTNSRILLGIPVYNEAAHVTEVLRAARPHAEHMLVIDDGSTDATPHLLAEEPVPCIRHARNRGYGRSMQEMIRYAIADSYDWLITMDCDLQHDPEAIPSFVAAIEEEDADVISGSRYLRQHSDDDAPPIDRRSINAALTTMINQRLGLRITDAFCGFKAYRVSACEPMCLDVDGYDFPMQFWVQAWHHGLRIREIPVRLVYPDLNRTFGGELDDAVVRRRVYEDTFQRAMISCGSSDALVRG